ncbi:hypothetical protein BVX95_00865 [archaeon D22]|nr:hypothetical protein BVX95_00865 [archaeon D22]
MVNVSYDDIFKKKFSKVKDNSSKEKIKKQIRKIINSPEMGKPMRYDRKGTRELYIAPYRLSYLYIEDRDEVVFLDLYHKDLQ